MRKTREIVRRYFNKYTSLSPVTHDLTDDQKRLQAEFDDRTLLRWNYLTKTNQVWYNALSGLYCVLSQEPPLCLGEIFQFLRERQKTKRQALKAYQDYKEAQEKEVDGKIAATVGETTDALQSWSVEKVTTSGKGLCP